MAKSKRRPADDPEETALKLAAVEKARASLAEGRWVENEGGPCLAEGPRRRALPAPPGRARPSQVRVVWSDEPLDDGGPGAAIVSPRRGRPGAAPGTREFVLVRPYTVIYEVGEDGVTILPCGMARSG